ncbi:MAG TPA: very short patch repair endonuclease [Clostridiales bacterium]|nr:very short patch repair endonuclease [Clostridiales bacterium]
MVDKLTAEKRSEIMSKIKGKNTTIEIKVRKYLFSKGFRYRKNGKRYPGTPDLVLPKYKTAVFINGCFWHGHENCKLYRLPKSNVEFWQKKIERNQTNDLLNRTKLEEMGFQVIVIWECELRKSFDDCMNGVVCAIDPDKV